MVVCKFCHICPLTMLARSDQKQNPTAPNKTFPHLVVQVIKMVLNQFAKVAAVTASPKVVITIQIHANQPAITTVAASYGRSCDHLLQPSLPASHRQNQKRSQVIPSPAIFFTCLQYSPTHLCSVFPILGARALTQHPCVPSKYQCICSERHVYTEQTECQQIAKIIIIIIIKNVLLGHLSIKVTGSTSWLV